MDKSELSKLIKEIRKISYVKPQEIPDIELYMDQVTTFMDHHLETTKRFSEDKLLTKTMINNYTKNDLLPSPNKKKYSKNHMILLIYIYYLKNILSITDISTILNPLTESLFDGEGEITLEELYSIVYKAEFSQAYDVIKDAAKKKAKSEEYFENVKDEKLKNYLKKFLYICMLSYDIYVKRQLLLKTIDTEFMPNDEDNDKQAPSEKKGEEESSSEAHEKKK